jgi:WD40 repeat protein
LRFGSSEVDGIFFPVVALTLLTILGWAVYVLSYRVRIRFLILVGLLLVVYLILAIFAGGRPAAIVRAFRQHLVVPTVSWRWVALVGVVVAAGIVYRLVTWPEMRVAGDGMGYDYMAAAAAQSHRFVIIPYRTPGYPFLLFWTYLAAGISNYVAVYGVHLVLATLTGILMMTTVLAVTGQRLAAMVALVIGMLWSPMASASGLLMTELPTMFLCVLTIALLVNLLYRRHIASSAAALGPSLALLYEMRTPMVLWTLAAGLTALFLRQLRWRDRALLVSGAAAILLPITIVNYSSPYRVLTPGPVLDLTAAALGSDRFSLYPSGPNSPHLMEAMYDATITDGAGVDAWSDRPPAEWPSISRERQSIIAGYVAHHLGNTLQLSLRRAALLYRADQFWDVTYPAHLPEGWFLVGDLILLLAALGVVVNVRKYPRLVFALVLFFVSYTAPIAFIHVEPRYGLPAYPAIAMLAAIGLGAALTGIARWRRDVRQRLVGSASLALVLGVAMLGMEAWWWPALANDYAPRPAAGAGELASCYLGPHMPATAAWQPLHPTVRAAGINGLARWDLSSGRCQWQGSSFEAFWDVSYSADGRRVALATHALRVLDDESKRVIATDFYGGFAGGTGTDMTSASLNASGTRLAFASTGLRFFGVADLDGHAPLTRLAVGGYAIATRWAPSGTYLAASSSDGIIHLYDATPAEVQTISLATLPLALAWSPAGDRLAVGDARGRVWIWQVRSGSEPLVLQGSFRAHDQAVRSLAFSPDGSAIATASSDGRARVWQADDHHLLGTLSGHTATVWSISWSANGRCLLTAAADGSLKIWSNPGGTGAGSVAACVE